MRLVLKSLHFNTMSKYDKVLLSLSFVLFLSSVIIFGVTKLDNLTMFLSKYHLSSISFSFRARSKSTCELKTRRARSRLFEVENVNSINESIIPTPLLLTTELPHLRQNLYVTVNMRSRLGNRLFMYAAIIGVAARSGRQPVLSSKTIKIIGGCISGLPINDHIIRSRYTNWTRIQERSPVSYNNQTENLPLRNVTIGTFLQNKLYFAESENLVRQKMVFIPSILNRVRSFIKLHVPEMYSAIGRRRMYYLVIVHIRLTDFLKGAGSHRGYIRPNSTYFHHAMDYFRNCYDYLKFLVVSDDMRAAKKLVTGPDVIYVEGLSPCETMALASLSDHVIMTMGTFGVWLAWFTNGTAVRPRNLMVKNSASYRTYNDVIDYYYLGETIAI